MKNLENLINDIRISSGIDSTITKSNKTTEELIETVKTYKDVCLELNEKEYSLNDFLFLPEKYRIKHLTTIQLQQISRLFNGDWVINWTNTEQYKHFPYFQKSGSGWRFSGSLCYYDTTDGSVVYYQTSKIATFVGKQFLKIYIDYLESI